MKKKISIGIPCFNEELNVFPAYKALYALAKSLPKYQFEFIFVDNGSFDHTRDYIRQIARSDSRVKGVFLSRNFGPESSGQAAVDHATGDAFIFYECDMQDPIHLVPEFIKKWEEGNNLVLGVRSKIEDNLVMTVLRKSFYKFFKLVSNIEVPVNAGSFSLMDRQVVNAMNSLPEKYRFHRGLRAWVGFQTAYVYYERKKRERGRSSYRLFDYLRHAERSFFGFSYVPLDFMVYFGVFLVVISFAVLLFYLLYRMVYYPGHITDLPVILCAVIFFGGIQLLALSVVGKYVQVIVEETKARPLYIVEEVVKKG